MDLCNGISKITKLTCHFAVEKPHHIHWPITTWIKITMLIDQVLMEHMMCTMADQGLQAQVSLIVYIFFQNALIIIVISKVSYDVASF